MRIFDDLLTLDSLAQEYGVFIKSRKSAVRIPSDLRFGQIICNKYLVSGQSAPEIFYAEDAKEVYWLIVDVLVNQES